MATFDPSQFNSGSDALNSLENLSGSSGGGSSNGFLNTFAGIGGAVGALSLMQSGFSMESNAFAQEASLDTIGGNFSASMDIQGSQYASNLALQGGQIAAQFATLGGAMDAQRYRMEGDAAVAEANYNISLNDYNVNRQFDSLQRNMQDVFSSNKAVQGASGLSMGSHSYLAVTNAAMSQYERNIIQLHNNGLIKDNALRYVGQVQQTETENQALTAEYGAKVTSTLANYSAGVASAVDLYQGQAAATAAKYQAKLNAQQAKYQQEQIDYQASQEKTSKIGSLLGQVSQFL